MLKNNRHPLRRYQKIKITFVTAVLALAALAVVGFKGEVFSFAQGGVTSLAVPLNQRAFDPVMQGANLTANASVAGVWSAVQAWPLNGIHVAVLPDGKVLSYGTPQNAPGSQDGRTYDYWTPALGFGANSHQTTTDNNRPNSFCGSSAYLGDGRLFLTGGNSPVNSSVINWKTGAWTTDQSALADQRWYTTMLTLADGRLVVLGGMDPYNEGMQSNPDAAIASGIVSMTPELYTPGVGWRTLLGATSRDAFGPDFLRCSYPRAFVAPDGRVFGLSADNLWYLDVAANNGTGAITLPGKWKTPAANTPVNAGATMSAVMYAPGKLLVVGGNGSFNGEAYNASNMATTVDINGATPVVSETNRMNFARRLLNTVALPDGKVLATGGTKFANNGGTDAVYAAEIWNPATGTWTVGASAGVIRNYHASTVLLPNGTVLSVGGGAPGPVDNQNAEIYYPPYLFTQTGGSTQLAARPVMIGVNALNFAFGAQLQIQMADSSAIASLALIRNGSVTHAFNNGQRFQKLNFTQSGDMLTATLPANGNLAPPGYYQVYAVNSSGVPSQAVIISIGQSQAGTLPTPTPTPVPLGSEWVNAGNNASRIAISADNTLAIVNSVTGNAWRKTGDDTTQNWAQLTAKALSAVAVPNANSTWAVGTDTNVWRHAANAWTQTGVATLDIAAASDNTFVVINAGNNGVWRKFGDDTTQNWANVAGQLKRVALVNRNSIWGIGLDDGVYRHDGTNWVRVGTGVARSLAAAANGTLAYVDRDNGNLFIKNGDDATANWTQIAGQAKEVAVAQSGALWIVTSAGEVYRRAPNAGLPTLGSINAPPRVTGTNVSYAPGLEATGLTFSWNFGDGSAVTSFTATSAVSHVFPGPGQFLVTLTVRNAAGQSASKSFIQAIYAPPTANAPRASTQMLLEPRTNAATRLWVVNPDNQSVSVFDTTTNARTNEITVGLSPQSLARAADGSIWVANRDSATISVINPSTLAVTRSIALPVASQPYGLVIAPSGQAFVCLEATGQVLRLDGSTGAVAAALNVGTAPRHLSVSADSSRLLVARFVTPLAAGENTATVDTTNAGGEVLVINAATLALTKTVKLQHSDKTDTEIQGAGLPNYLGAPVITPDGTSAWVPSKQDNIKRGVLRSGQNLNFQNAVRAISSRINLSTLAENYAARVDHDNAGLASAAAFDPTGSYLFVALETSRQVAVVNPLAQGELFRIPVGIAPQGLTVAADGKRLFVHNFMGRTISVIDLAPLMNNGEFRATTVATIATVATDKLAANVLQGKRLFYDAADTRLARDSYISCAVCHSNGGQDGRVWDFTGFGEGLRNTIALNGRAGAQGFQHWSGNFDEIQDFEGQIRNFAGGTGLMTDAQFNTGTRNQPLGDRKTGLSVDLDALAAYLASLNTFAPSPYRANRALTADAVAGREVFRTANCAQCHSGTAFTESGAATLRNIGTLKSTSGSRLGGPLSGLDTPTLRDVWSTAPYLHDGSAATLGEAVTAHQGVSLTSTNLAQLVAYLQQIGSEEASAPAKNVAPTVTLTAPASNAAFAAPATLTLTASAADSDGSVARVEFYNGATKLGEDTTAPYSFTWANVGAGTYSLLARALDNEGAATYSTAVNVTVSAVVAGTGLRGEYFDNADFTAAKLMRTDATVNFDWGTGTPDATVGADSFSVRWTGQVQAKFTETYTFYTTSDDGVRLWVNNQLLINNWTDHAPTENSATIALVANQRYEIRMEYFENGGGAVARLSWSSPSQAKQVIPQACLYSGLPATVFVSDLTPTAQVNGWGTYERDRSNGEQGAADGRTLTLNGVTYAKGLGVHAASDLKFNLNGEFKSFRADIGLDDEVGNQGSVVFQVWLDGQKLYDSGTLNGATATKQLTLDVTGKRELRLVVTNGGDNLNYDHADWANARLLR